MTDSWNQVSKSAKSRNKTNKKDLTLELIINSIKIISLKYNPRSVYIYGSRSRMTNKSYSDIDILIIWNKEPKFHNIKNEIVETLKLPVDIVEMIYKNKFIDNGSNSFFLDNVYNEATHAYGVNQKDEIFLSFSLGKIK